MAYVAHKDIKLYQMNAKSAFLNQFINEEVYMKQPPDFKDKEKPQHVYKLFKALYGWKQAPRAWYEIINLFLVQNGFSRGIVDTTLFRKSGKGDLLIVQIYVDDIIFGATIEMMCKGFSKLKKGAFEMSM